METTKGLHERIDKLEALVLELTETVKLLTEADDRAKVFIARIEEIAKTIKTKEG